MNKLLTKIVGVALGASLAVGIGVAAVSNRDVVDSQVNAAISYDDLTLVTSASTLDTSKKYVYGTGKTSGAKYLTDSASTSWGGYTTSLAEATQWSVSSTSASDFYLYSGTKMLSALTSNSFSLVTTGTPTNQKLDASGTLHHVSTDARTLRCNGTSGFRWYANTTGTQCYLYEVEASSSSETLYTVSFDPNMYEYTETIESVTQTSEGASVVLPSPTYADYSFVGWNTSEQGGSATRVTSPYTPTDDVTLHGEWIENIPSGAQAYHLKDMDGFSSWGVGYNAHSHDFTTDDDTITVSLASAGKQTGTITTVPVTKGGDVELKLTSSSHYISSVIFVAKQWTTKAQTMTLHTSSDGGSNYSSTGVTSTNFRIQNQTTFSEGTNAVKISFSSTDNQVGLVKFYVTFADLSSSYTVSSGTSGLTVSPLNITADGGNVTLTTAALSKATSIAATNATISATNGNVITLSNVTGNVVITATLTSADITSIEVKNPITEFSLSDDFSFGGSVEATYDDFVTPHSVVTLDSSDYVVDSENAFRKGVAGTYTIRVTCGSVYDEYEVTVADITYYTLVENADDLVDGAEIILVTNKTTASIEHRYAMTRTIASSLNGFAQVNVSNDSVYRTNTTEAYSYTLVENADGWSLYNEATENYLVSETNKKMSEAATATSNWDISISNGVATMTSNYASSVGHIMFNWNSGSARFTTYTGAESATMVLPSIYQYTPTPKTISDTRLTTSSGSISAEVGADGWTVSGFVFEVQYEGESTWNVVNPVYTVTESVPTSYDSIGEYPVHFKITYKGNDYYANTPFTATVIDDMTPISLFHTNELDTNTTYTYRGTVIGIEGNSYYLQQDQSGILIYGGTTEPPTGMKVGDLVKVTSKVQNYKGYVIENNGGAGTAEIMGTGSLPAAPQVSTVSAFNSHPQSTRVTFNGLERNDSGQTITWDGTWAYKSADQSATVQDSTGATITLYVSRYLDSTTANAIISKINTITVDDTFDLFQGVKVVSTSDGSARLSIMSADQITIHTPTEDPIQTWIDTYMFMEDERFEGDGTGLCLSQSFYVNAKAGLKTVEDSHSGSIATFEADAEGKYADALARYKKWAIACNDGDPFDGEATIVTPLRSSTINMVMANESFNIVAIITAISLLSVAAYGAYFFLRKKKEQ